MSDYNYFLLIVVIYLYVSSWMDAFRFRNITKRLEKLEKNYG